MNKGDTHVTYAVIRNINPQQYLIEKPWVLILYV
jgi:hypothetical protein